MVSKPLEGVRLVEAAGPQCPQAVALALGMCGRIAADLGADVVRIGSRSEPRDEVVERFLHGGKRRIDIADEDFTMRLRAEAAGTDGVVLDPDSHARLRPESPVASLVVVAMSIDAPLEGTEFTIEARSGLLDLVGDPNRQPLRLGGHQIAYAGGLAAYLALIASLSRLPAGPAPAVSRVDLMDVAVWLNWKTLATSLRSGVSPSRRGADAEWSVAPCRDGHVATVYRTQDWEALKQILCDPRLEAERFQTALARRQNRRELNGILREAFRGLTRAEIKDLALVKRLPLGPVWTPEDLKRDPHLAQRGFFQAMDGEPARLMPTLPVKWNRRGVAPARRATDEPSATVPRPLAG